MLKSMKEMEQENRRLLQEEADKKIADLADKAENQQKHTMSADAEKNKMAHQEAEAKKQAEQQTLHEADLKAQADHQSELDHVADINQKNQAASIGGTQTVQAAQMPSDLAIKQAPVIAKDQGEYHTRNATGDGSLGSFVVRGSGELDYASTQKFKQSQAAEQEKQKENDKEMEM